MNSVREGNARQLGGRRNYDELATTQSLACAAILMVGAYA